MRAIMLSLLALLVTSSAARAEWMEASSQHFVIYADEKPEELREFSEQLERFHHAMALVLASTPAPPSPSNRVTIYVVRNDREVRKLLGGGSRDTYAFYRANAGDSFAIVPRVETRYGPLDMPMIALLHEYAHHFLISASSYAWPRWFTEGSAEFLSSAQFRKSGGVALGLPAAHRAGDLHYARDVTARELIDSDHKRRRGWHAFYGKSWLLYHYLTFNSERKGQFATYLTLLRQGKSSAEAGEAAFGDLDQLERDIEIYLRQRRMTSFELPAETLQPGPVAIRTLSAGEAAAMPLRIRLKNRPSPEELETVLAELRAVATRHTGDPSVLATLAEAEFEAGNNTAAIAAADAALAIDPRHGEAHLNKGKALFRQAADASDPAAAYAEARRPFLALNALEHDHPLPLLYFYRSFTDQGLRPTENAIQALERAASLAPFDMGVRMTLAFQQIRDKRHDDAALNLAPIAFHPHGGGGAEVAQRLLDRLNDRDARDSIDLDALLSEFRTELAAEGAAEGEEGAED